MHAATASTPRPGVTPMTFVGGEAGLWQIERIRAVKGNTLPPAPRLGIEAGLASPAQAIWALRGVAGHARYVNRPERGPLDQASPSLRRPEATSGCLIAIRKTDDWWRHTQDERRAIFEEGSHHIARSMKYLPAIARALLQSRDLGEPHDFLAWFEFAPTDVGAFSELLAELRSTEEWTYVNREVEVWVNQVDRV